VLFRRVKLARIDAEAACSRGAAMMMERRLAPRIAVQRARAARRLRRRSVFGALVNGVDLALHAAGARLINRDADAIRVGGPLSMLLAQTVLHPHVKSVLGHGRNTQTALRMLRQPKRAQLHRGPLLLLASLPNPAEPPAPVDAEGGLLLRLVLLSSCMRLYAEYSRVTQVVAVLVHMPEQVSVRGLARNCDRDRSQQ